MKEIIDQLTNERKRHRLSQAEIADAIGVTVMAVSLWENHRRFPKMAGSWRASAVCRTYVVPHHP